MLEGRIDVSQIKEEVGRRPIEVEAMEIFNKYLEPIRGVRLHGDYPDVIRELTELFARELDKINARLDEQWSEVTTS